MSNFSEDPKTGVFSDSSQNIILDPNRADVTAGGNGMNGDIRLLDTANPGKERIHIGTEGPNLWGLRIKDEKGNVRALLHANGGLVLGTEGADGDLLIHDATGIPSLQVDGDSHSMVLYDESGKKNIVLGIGSLVINDADGKKFLEIVSDDPLYGERMHLLDESGQSPVIILGRGKNASLCNISAKSEGNPVVTFENLDSHPADATFPALLCRHDGGGDGIAGESAKGTAIRGSVDKEVKRNPTASDARGIAAGVFGQAVETFGVIGYSQKQAGVYGESWSGTEPAIWGSNRNGGIGILGQSVLGVDAGRFLGNVTVNGILYTKGKNFKIDHPVDPENKFLNHASVESSEQTTLYSGTVTLDKHGRARVSLPKWFEALNIHLRYQLTPIGSPAPNLHIAEEIAKCQFKIADGTPGMKVCWLITAVRQDAFAKAHPLVVEEGKGKDRGRYLSPIEHGVPESKGMHFERTRVAKVNLQPRSARASGKKERKPAANSGQEAPGKS